MSLLSPKERIPHLSALPPKSLRQRGFRLVLLDLDHVLLPLDGKEISAEMNQWVNKAQKAGLKLYLLSNSKSRQRVANMCERLQIPGVSWALKPLPFAYRRALKSMGASVKETAAIGDQLFTDILGANLLGIHSILVPPLAPEKHWNRKVMRWIERFLGR